MVDEVQISDLGVRLHDLLGIPKLREHFFIRGGDVVGQRKRTECAENVYDVTVADGLAATFIV
jgi:hypothetical protein